MTISAVPGAAPTLTIGVPASTGEDDLPATLASLAASAAQCAGVVEIVVAVNGPDEPAAAAVGAERFAREAGLPLIAPGAAPPATGACVRLLDPPAGTAERRNGEPAHHASAPPGIEE